MSTYISLIFSSTLDLNEIEHVSVLVIQLLVSLKHLNFKFNVWNLTSDLSDDSLDHSRVFS